MESPWRCWLLLIVLGLAACRGQSNSTPSPGDAGPLADTAVDSAVLSPSPVTLDAAENMTCAVRGGEVWCWGGPPGCDPSRASGLPRRVPGLTGVVQVAVGTELACAMGEEGAVDCWAIGGGDLSASAIDGPWEPFAVPDLVGTVKLAAGADVCALSEEGRVRCFASGEEGLLGPDYVDLPWDIVDLSVGPWFACAVRAAGEVLCWDAGKWTVGPQEVNYVVTTSQLDLSTSAELVAVTASGWCVSGDVATVECWTDQPDGPDGVFVEVPDSAPNEEIVALDADNETFCARYAGGVVVCWLESLGPAHAWQPMLEPVAAWATGADHFCAVNGAGASLCLGGNGAGQLGQGEPADVLTLSKTAATLPADVEFISSGDAATCLVNSSGRIRCWGGGGGQAPLTAPTELPDAPGEVAGWSTVSVAGELVSSKSQVCALSQSGLVWCLDYPAESSSLTWQTIPLPGSAYALAADDGESGCALMAAGTVVCWHRGATVQTAEVPTGGSPLAAISCLMGHCCAIDPEAGVLCFDNPASLGQDEPGPIAFPDLGGEQIVVGEETACALDPEGVIWCWGFNGRCGIGSATPLPTAAQPVAVPLPEPAVGLAAGRLFNCAQLESGDLNCWGELDATCHLSLGAPPDSCLPGSYAGPGSTSGFLTGAGDHLILATPGQPLHYLGRNQFGEIPGAPPPRSEVPLAVVFSEMR